MRCVEKYEISHCSGLRGLGIGARLHELQGLCDEKCSCVASK